MDARICSYIKQPKEKQQLKIDVGEIIHVYVPVDPNTGPRAPEARPHRSDGGELVYIL